MTVEKGGWPSQELQPLPQEIKTQRDAEEEKYAHLIQAIFDHAINLAVTSRGLPKINGSIDEFDLSTVLKPRQHVPGNIREGLFEDAVYIRDTTTNLVDSLHTLILYTDGRPHEYQVVGLNLEGQNEPVHNSFVGIEEIASKPNVLNTLIDLGGIKQSFEREKRDRWPRQLTEMDLRNAHKSHNVS